MGKMEDFIKDIRLEIEGSHTYDKCAERVVKIILRREKELLDDVERPLKSYRRPFRLPDGYLFEAHKHIEEALSIINSKRELLKSNG